MFSIFFMALFLVKKRPLFYYFFISNFFIVNISILTAFWSITDVYVKFPHLYRIPSPLHYLIAPFTYFTVRLVLLPEKRFKMFDLIHFIPFIFHFVELVPFYLKSGNEKISFLMNVYVYEKKNPWLVIDGLYFSFRTHILIKFSLLFIYCLFSLRLIFQFKSKVGKYFLEKNKILYTFITLETCNKLLLSISTVFITYFFINNFQAIMILPPIFFGLDILISASLILIFPSLLLGLKPIKSNFLNKFEKINNINQENSSNNFNLKSDSYHGYFNAIELIMQKNQPFLDDSFTRKKLARLINIPESTVTKAIQFKTNLSFNDYLNSYRIEFLISKLKSTPSWFDFTIEAMALKSGFANRVTFNNALKKIKGQKPSELIKELKNL